jgi:hypothetical protein
MKYKPYVRIDALVQPMLEALHTIDESFRHYGEEPTVTSGCEDCSPHMKGSKHYTGEAVDLRSHDFNEVLRGMIQQRMKADLGPDFQVIYEPDMWNSKGERVRYAHYHVEFQPATKGPENAAA